MNELQKPIPTEKDFMINKISDLVYGYLQTQSYIGKNTKGEEVSLVYKTNYLIDDISRATKIKKRTVYNKVKNLVNSGYIKEEEVFDKDGHVKKAYTFKTINLYQKVNMETLRYLVSTGNDNVIKVYVYLLNRYLYKQNINKQYLFSERDIILDCFGITSTTHSSDYKKVHDILNCLINNNLLILGDKKVKKDMGTKGTTYYFRVVGMNLYYKDNIGKIIDISDMQF